MSDRTPSRAAGMLFRRVFAPFLVAAAIVVIASPLEARRPPPPRPPMPPTPSPAPSPEGGFLCDTALEAPASVKAAFQEYHECTGPILGGWLEKHTEAVAALEILYDRWMEARRHDLRERPEAGRWARRHAVDFSSSEVELTPRQLQQLGPTMQGASVPIPGAFQRIFVDRENNRLFLTSETDGLVSIDISQRYAFAFESLVGTAGATDFFVVDETTAFVEETVEEGANRDLVVLDISDREQPREVARLKGVIPTVGPAATFTSSMARRPPTFDQYLLLREGRLPVTECGAPPTVSTHPGIFCRSDGSCYRREALEQPNEGLCERVPPAQRRIAMGLVVRDTDGGWSERTREPRVRRRTAPVARGAPPVESATPTLESAAPVMADEAAPEGGAGGAGSLSQMMLYGSTLYVLSGSHGQPDGWLTTFDITRPRRPTIAHVIKLDNGPEALQRHDNLLLVAGRDALVTVSLGLSTAPRLLGEYRQDCPVTFDPVVIQGSIAYRTIIVEQRTSACSSRLEVIELSSPHQPVLRTTRALTRPRGLAVLGERLFIADEERGVYVFDLTDPVNPSETGVLPLKAVKDLVISGFDLYALTPYQVETYWVGPLFERGVTAQAGFERTEGFTTVKRRDNVRLRDARSSRQGEGEEGDQDRRRRGFPFFRPSE